MEKPYNETKEVTYEMITTHPYFKTLPFEELARVVEYMDFEGYEKLEGAMKDKAKILFNKFKEEAMEEKEIIGYKVKPKFIRDKKVGKAIASIEGYMELGESIVDENMSIIHIPAKQAAIDKLSAYKVLDLWFDPVYKEVFEFKIGDWVTKVDGWYIPYDGIVTHKIKKIEEEAIYVDWKACPGAGDGISAFRKATEDEIFEALKKEFIERTGIDVGSIVSEKDASKYTIDKFILVHEANYDDHSYAIQSGFRNTKEKYLLGIECNASCFSLIAENVKLCKTLTFGGEPVTLEKVSSGIRITCNGETGTYSQLEAIYEHLKEENQVLTFGNQKLRKVTYMDDNTWDIEDGTDRVKFITIGCTTGTWEELESILKACKELNNN